MRFGRGVYPLGPLPGNGPGLVEAHSEFKTASVLHSPGDEEGAALRSAGRAQRGNSGLLPFRGILDPSIPLKPRNDRHFRRIRSCTSIAPALPFWWVFHNHMSERLGLWQIQKTLANITFARVMAESKRFELLNGSPRYTISNRAPSATRTTLQERLPCKQGMESLAWRVSLTKVRTAVARPDCGFAACQATMGP